MRISWKTESRDLGSLVPSKYNPRRWPEKETKDLQKSLEKFNLADPLIINQNNIIIGGHFRYKLLREKGVREVDVRVPSRLLTKQEEKELNLRLNRNLGLWDLDILSSFDSDLLKDVGFDSSELDKIFSLDVDDKDDDAPNPQEESNTKTGDIYLLGRHRVMCGDSTKVDDVDKLMDGKKSNMIHTDPPYNVDYGSSKNPRHKIKRIENDSMSAEEWKDFCHAIYSIFNVYNEGDIYMWGASSPEGMRMRLWLVELGCHWSATIVWKKQQLVLSPANYQRMYEPCFYGWFDKSSFVAERKETEVWVSKSTFKIKATPYNEAC